MCAEKCPEVGAGGSGCDHAILFTFSFSPYLYMQPHNQTSHFKNYQSVCYEEVASTIHVHTYMYSTSHLNVYVLGINH